MKRIVIFCHDRAVSGANLSLLDYLKDYDRTQYQVLVVLPHKGTEMCSKLEELKIKYAILNLFSVTKSIGNVSIKIKLKKLYQRIVNGIEYPFRISRLEKILKDYSPDYIISNSFATTYGAILAKRLQVKHIFHIREYLDLDHQTTHFNHKKVSEFCKGSYAVFISNSIRDYYATKYSFIDSCVLYDRVSEDATFKRSRDFYEDGIIKMLIAGSLIPNKGQLDAIEASGELDNEGIKAELFICGKGPDEARLKKYVRDNSIERVHFLGYVTNLNELRKNIDISLVCSKNEALGRVTVESMYTHSLTIGTNSGETRYLLADGRGLLYNYGDAKGLAGQISWAVNNVEQVQQITDRALLYARNNFNKDILNSIIKWVEEHNEKKA